MKKKFQDLVRQSTSTEAQNTLSSAKGIPLGSQSNTVHSNSDLLTRKGEEVDFIVQQESPQQVYVSTPGCHILLIISHWILDI